MGAVDLAIAGLDIAKKTYDLLGGPKPSADTGTVKSTTGADPGIVSDDASGYDTPIYGGSNYSGGLGGGSRSGSASSSNPKKTQASLDNTAANYGLRKGDVDKNTKGYVKSLEGAAKDRLGDMNKVGKMQLGNINQQRQANDAALKSVQSQLQRNIQWQPNQQKEQSTLMALRNRMGNAAYGSGIQDLAEGMQRVDDMNDVELINTWKQNEDAAYNNWYQAEQALIGDYNDQVASILDEMSQFKADYQNQIDKVKFNYGDEISQLYSQYWSNLSNIDPELASAENMKTSRQNALGKTAVKEAKDVQKAVKSLMKSYKGDGKEISTKGLDGAKKTAAEYINKQIKALGKKSDSSTVLKKALNNATKAYNKAVKNAGKKNKPAYAKDQENRPEANDLTLPNVDFRSKANLKSKLKIQPDASLSKMLTTKGNANPVNKRTLSYIRGDASTPMSNTTRTPMGGTIDNSRAANTGFSDNLAAFRRM